MFVGKDFTQPKIDEITVNGPAEKAGLKKNDIIIAIDVTGPGRFAPLPKLGQVKIKTR